VSHGIKSTAGVVTSAAAVMVAVFAIFATLSAIDFKMMGIGLATAILIDATIVRAVLLPATMKLLGDWNWYLPSKLNWLPRIGGEHSSPAPEAACGELQLRCLSPELQRYGFTFWLRCSTLSGSQARLSAWSLGSLSP